MAVCLYDPVKRIGALCHSLLPERNAEDRPPSPKFTTEAVDMMVKDLTEEGASLDALQAKVVGGASIFEALAEYEDLRMGEKNVQAARSRTGHRGGHGDFTF